MDSTLAKSVGENASFRLENPEFWPKAVPSSSSSSNRELFIGIRYVLLSREFLVAPFGCEILEFVGGTRLRIEFNSWLDLIRASFDDGITKWGNLFPNLVKLSFLIDRSLTFEFCCNRNFDEFQTLFEWRNRCSSFLNFTPTLFSASPRSTKRSILSR